MSWDRDVVFTELCGRETNVTTGLARSPVPEPTKSLYEIAAREISWQPHTAMIS